MKKIFGIVFTLLSVIGYAGAQTLEIGGELIGAANMKFTDAARFSQTEHSYMTARVAAMGGAFTSLGADLSSMAINPAGLGMYRSSVGSISGAFTNTNASNSFAPYGSEQRLMSLNSAGMALNLFQSSGPLVSFTFGFAYNKLADLNYNQNYTIEGQKSSIADFFAEQMFGIEQKILASDAYPFDNENIYVDEWGGVLAYQTRLIDPEDENNPQNTLYRVPAIGVNADIFPQMNINSRGYVGEYDLSSGMNFGNKFYLGFTVGIQDIYQRINYDYSETYNHNLAAGVDASGYLDNMRYSPYEKSVGTGVNFKIGAILRPTKGLRLGIAYHTPTAVALNRTFAASMKTVFNDGIEIQGSSLVNNYTYNYTSPSKLLLGLSYTLGSVAVISFDYDMVWYDGLRLTGEAYEYEDAFRNDVQAHYTTAKNFRAGIELRPVKSLYVRGGYAFYGSPYKIELETELENDDTIFYFGNNKRSTEALSLGLGFRLDSGSSLDVAWVRTTANYTNHVLYSYYYEDADQKVIAESLTVKDTKHVKNIVSATYTFTF